MRALFRAGPLSAWIEVPEPIPHRWELPIVLRGPSAIKSIGSASVPMSVSAIRLKFINTDVHAGSPVYDLEEL